ncbi:MAG: hypothetical protein K2X27_12690, partial [Candidatus Obscuribacterales bacterium]|nr:hypothetical protein [Candidatus Obscuribacterales bacterium]
MSKASRLSLSLGYVNELGGVLSRIVLLFLLALALNACDGNYLSWSSDGKLAALIGSKGLRVADADGQVSPILMDRAGLFRWLPQDHQGLLVDYDYVKSWSELKSYLNAAQEKQILEESLRLKRKIYVYRAAPEKFAESNLRSFSYPLEAAIYLHSSAAPDIDKMARAKWTEYRSVKVPIFAIKHVQIEGKTLKLLRVLNKSVDELVEIRPAPNGKFLAAVKHDRAGQKNYLQI